MKEQQKRKIQQFHPEIEDGIDLRRCPHQQGQQMFCPEDILSWLPWTFCQDRFMRHFFQPDLLGRFVRTTSDVLSGYISTQYRGSSAKVVLNYCPSDQVICQSIAKLVLNPDKTSFRWSWQNVFLTKCPFWQKVYRPISNSFNINMFLDDIVTRQGQNCLVSKASISKSVIQWQV